MKVSHEVVPVTLLPLVDLCDDLHGRNLCDELSRLLRDSIAARPALCVTTCVATVPRKRVRLSTLDGARALVVKGFVLRSGAQIQVAVGLVDATTGALLLTRTYVGQVETVMRIPAAIASSIATEIEAALRHPRAAARARAG